jgi:hypothetical protein
MYGGEMQAKKAIVIPMPGAAAQPGRRKTIPCRQAEVDAVPLGTGDWTIADVPGLILRAGTTQEDLAACNAA